MKNLTVGKRIIAGFAAIIVISALLGVFAVRQLHAISTLSTVTTTESLAGMEVPFRPVVPTVYTPA